MENQLKAGILITAYNDPPAQLNSVLLSAYGQDYENLLIVLVDDGSDTPLADSIEFSWDPSHLVVSRISHGERAAAREWGLKLLREADAAYMLFLDSDMAIPPNLVGECVKSLVRHNAAAIVIPELAYSEHSNYWTRVKVFERNLYRSGAAVDGSSIEAARFWRCSAFPGFIHGLNAFEEIQPTIECLRRGGVIVKADQVCIRHNEKRVSLGRLLEKKRYYFDQMSGHSRVRTLDMVKRYYLFRRQLYTRENLVQYIRHPLLAFGVLMMYLLLTWFSGQAMLKRGAGISK